MGVHWIFLLILAAYFLGSLPFGLLLGYLFGLGDIRHQGSGNIGSTNVLRVGNKWMGFLVLLLDFSKGMVCVFVAYNMGGGGGEGGEGGGMVLGMLLALCAVCGHIFPIWLRFRGGKGVAVGLGALFAVDFFMGLGGAMVWLIVFALFRISSLSSLVAFAVVPLWVYVIGENWIVAGLCGILSVLIWGRHWANLQRLLRGEEEKLHLG